MRGDDDSAQAGVGAREAPRDERPTVFFEDLPPVAQSLVRAFESGIAWTPDFHRAFVKGGPLDRFLSHSAAWGASGSDGTTDQRFASSPPASGPTYTDIDGEVLYEILSHTIIEREDKAQSGIEIRNTQAHKWIDAETKKNKIEFDRRGIKAEHLRVTHPDTDGIVLNCFGINQPIPIQLVDCAFMGRVVFDSARLGPLSLEGAKFEAASPGKPHFSADATTFEGPLNLNRLQCRGVFLNFVRIGGLFSMEDAKIAEVDDVDEHEAYALAADGSTIESSVFLRHGFSAAGQVRCVRTKIGGNLDCEGGAFKNPKSYALLCDSAGIGGSTWLRDQANGPPFFAQGEVDFCGASIEGSFECSGRIENERKRAVNCAGINVAGSASFHGIYIGEVNLIGATIGLSLSCSMGQFENPGGTALDCDKIIVRQSVFLRNGFKATGVTDFMAANIGSQFACNDGYFRNRGGVALQLSAAKVDAELWLAGIRIDGKIDLQGADARILVVDEQSWPAPGKLNVRGFEYHAVAGSTFHPFTGCQPALEWLSLQDRYARWLALESQPWTQLASVFSSAGRTRDARDVLIDMNWRRTLGGLATFFIHLFWVPLNYVLRPLVLMLELVGRLCSVGIRISLARTAQARESLRKGFRESTEDFRRVLAYLIADILPPLAAAICAVLWADQNFHEPYLSDVGLRDWRNAFAVVVIMWLVGLLANADRRRRQWDNMRGNFFAVAAAGAYFILWIDQAQERPIIDNIGLSLSLAPHEAIVLIYSVSFLWSVSVPQRGWAMRLLSLAVAVPTNLILGALIGWGFRPILAGIWGLFFAITGWFVFSTTHEMGFMAAEPAYKDEYYVLPPGYEKFSPLVYSIDTLIPFVDLHQEAQWRPQNERFDCARDSAGAIVRQTTGKPYCIATAMPRPSLEGKTRADLLPPGMRALLKKYAPGLASKELSSQTVEWLEDRFEAGWARNYLWFHIAFGYILATMAAAAITGIVKLKE
jgi:hypothetical protein